MLRFYCSFLMIYCFNYIIFGQNRVSDSIQINGVYRDVDGFAMADYDVKIYDSNISTKTDDNGKFTLKIPIEIKDRVYLEYKDFNQVIYKLKVDDFQKELRLRMYENPVVKKSYVTTSDGPRNYNFIVKEKSFFRKIGRTISWPFRQIWKLF